MRKIGEGHLYEGNHCGLMKFSFLFLRPEGNGSHWSWFKMTWNPIPGDTDFVGFE